MSFPTLSGGCGRTGMPYAPLFLSTVLHRELSSTVLPSWNAVSSPLLSEPRKPSWLMGAGREKMGFALTV